MNANTFSDTMLLGDYIANKDDLKAVHIMVLATLW